MALPASIVSAQHPVSPAVEPTLELTAPPAFVPPVRPQQIESGRLGAPQTPDVRALPRAGGGGEDAAVEPLDAPPAIPQPPGSDAALPPDDGAAAAQDTPAPDTAAQDAAAAPQVPPASDLTSGLGTSLGVTAGSFSAAPNMIGDLFGGGLATTGVGQSVTTRLFTRGFVISPSSLPDQSDAILAFEANGGTPDDFFSSGSGTDASGDGVADTFSITEPLPPNEVPTSPGPGFTFSGGSAVYAPDGTSQTAQDGSFSSGDLWFATYTFAPSPGQGGGSGGGGTGGTAGVIVAGPDVATRRVKLSENFSPAPRDRCFFNYSFFNDTFGGLGDISRFVFGTERLIGSEDISIEARVPMAATYASDQTIGGRINRSFELGNVTLVSKFALLRTNRLLWSTGLGVTLPLADDSRLKQNGADVLRIENESVHLLPYSGLLYRLSRDTAVQLFTQFDFDTNGNPVLGSFAGGPLPQLGRINDSTLMFLDAQVAHTLHRGGRRDTVQALVASLELHYTTTLQDADAVAGNGFFVTDLSRRFDVLNLTTGLHFQLGKSLILTPALGVPLRDGLDEQFDYEAVFQVNYLN